MQNYFLAIPLPAQIKKQLAILCFGPPQIRWIDPEHLYYILNPFGNLSDIELKEIIDKLDTMFFSTFSFRIQNISCTQFKGSGIIGLKAQENQALLNLHKEAELTMRGLKIKKGNPQPFPVILGYFEKINIERLNDYLMSHDGFISDLIGVSGISLVRTWQSAKSTVYEEVAFFPASQATTGED